MALVDGLHRELYGCNWAKGPGAEVTLDARPQADSELIRESRGDIALVSPELFGVGPLHGETLQHEGRS